MPPLGACIESYAVLNFLYFNINVSFVCLAFWTPSSRSKGLSLVHVSSSASSRVGIQFSPVTKLCPTLCDSINISMLESSVLQYLLEFAQIHIHRFSDAI